MHKLLALFAVCFFAACNNSNNRQSTNGDSAKQTTNSGIPKDSVAREATFNFVDGCMDNFRVALGEASAYAFCKCIYNQIKVQNPGADSIQIEVLAQDTAMVNRIAETCRPNKK